MGNKIATREAYGKALVKLSNINENVVVLLTSSVGRCPSCGGAR